MKMTNDKAWATVILGVLCAAALAVAMGLCCCTGAPVVEPVYMGGRCDAHVAVDTPVGLTHLRIVGGADYSPGEDVGGHGQICVALNDGQYLCYVIAEECERDEQTGFCDETPAP